MSYFVIVFLLFLPIIYESSTTFRYHLKIILYYVLISLNACILIPIFIIRPKNVLNLIWGSYVSRNITHLVGIKWTLRNAHVFDDKSSCIVISNHQHSLDILGMFQFWHLIGKMTVVAKRQLLYVGPFGLSSWLCNLMFIDRKGGDRCRQQMSDQMDQLIKDDTKLWIFPEGTRRNTNQIHNFKKGAFFLAIQKQIPILPIVYSSYNHFLNDEMSSFDNGEIILTAMPHISTKGVKLEDIDAFMADVRLQMMEVYKSSTLDAKQAMIKNPMYLSKRLEKLRMRFEGKPAKLNNDDFEKETPSEESSK